MRRILIYRARAAFTSLRSHWHSAIQQKKQLRHLEQKKIIYLICLGLNCLEVAA